MADAIVERDRLREVNARLRLNFARFLAPLYLKNEVEIARLCDEELDQSGELLGLVRECSKELKQ